VQHNFPEAAIRYRLLGRYPSCIALFTGIGTGW
jgi:hypothetical protein